MMNRSHLGFLPIRDYFYFVSGETPLYPRERASPGRFGVASEPESQIQPG
jgi:hypothetical protein